MEPQRRGDQETGREKPETGRRLGGPEDPEGEKGHGRDHHLRVNVVGVEKDRGGQQRQDRQGVRRPVLSGFALERSPELKDEERADQRHAEPEDEDEAGLPEEGSQRIEGQKNEGRARRMEGIRSARLPAADDMRVEDRGDLHVGVVIPARVIVRQVEVAVGEQAARHEQIMRFVAGERDAAADNQRGAGVQGDERREKNERRFAAFPLPSVARADRAPDFLRPAPETGDLDPGQVNDGRHDPREKEQGPRPGVLAADVVRRNDRHRRERQEGEREPDPAPGDLPARKRQTPGDKGARQEPEGGERQEEQDGQSGEGRQRGPERMAENGEFGEPMQELREQRDGERRGRQDGRRGRRDLLRHGRMMSRAPPKVKKRSGDECRSRSEELGSLARGYAAGPGESGCSATRLALASFQSAIRARSPLDAPLRQEPYALFSIVRASFWKVQLARRGRNRGYEIRDMFQFSGIGTCPEFRFRVPVIPP